MEQLVTMDSRIVDVMSSKMFLSWFLALFIAWGILVLAFSQMSIFKDKPRGAAHQFVVAIPFTYLCVEGIRLWFFDAGFRVAFADDRVFGYYPPAYEMAVMIGAFQFWDFVTTLVSKELCKFQHLAHHGVTFALTMSATTNGPHGFVLYYIPFFVGVSEVSSVPLAFVDLFRMFKPLAEAAPAVNEAFRVSFAVSFLIVRCVYWPFVCVDFWRHLLASSAPFYLTVWWYMANIGMTGLQYFWGWLVVKGIWKLIKGDKSNRDDETEARSPIHSKLLDTEVGVV